MGLFDFFLKLTHPSKKPGWAETTAYFTGDVRKALKGRTGPFYPRVKSSYQPAEYNEYKIKFYVEDREMTGWYIFHPCPDPEPEEIQGMHIKIRYNKRRP